MPEVTDEDDIRGYFITRKVTTIAAQQKTFPLIQFQARTPLKDWVVETQLSLDKLRQKLEERAEVYVPVDDKLIEIINEYADHDELAVNFYDEDLNAFLDEDEKPWITNFNRNDSAADILKKLPPGFESADLNEILSIIRVPRKKPAA